MTLTIVLQFVVVLAAIWMGARYSGVGLGLWGAVGLLVLVVAFGVNPTSPPIDVMLIILAVIMAASVMDAAGGIDFLVRIAERIIRANPKYVTIVAPLTTWTLHLRRRHRPHRLSAAAGDLRDGAPERHPARAADGGGDDRLAAGDHREPGGRGDGGDDRPLRREGPRRSGACREILMVCVPATLTGVVAAAIVSMFIGKDLKDDPEYQARLAAGQIPAPQVGRASARRSSPRPRLSAFIFLAGVALVVLFGFFPSLRTLPGAKGALAMPIVIEIVMMSVAAIMLLVTKVDVDEVPKTATLRAGVVAVIGIFGLAWLGDSFIAAHKDVIVPAIGALGRGRALDLRVRPLLRLGAAVQPGGDDAGADAAGHGAGHPAAVPDRDVPVGQRLLLHPDLRLADRGDQLRPVGHDEDRQVRAQPLVHDPGRRRHRGRGDHRPGAGEGDVLSETE